MSSISIKFTTGVALLALLTALSLIDISDACAPTATNPTTTPPTTTKPAGGRRKRSTEEEDVHVVVVSNEQFDLARNEKNMEKVEQKLNKFAKNEGISFRALQNVEKAVENVGGKFGVHFEMAGAFDRCARVLQFIQAALNSLDEIVSGTVKCGAFDAVHVTKKKH